MKLDSVGRNAFLALQVIEEADASNLHRHVSHLKAGGWCEHSIKLRPSPGNPGGKGAAWPDASRSRNLSDHRASGAVRQHHVIIRIIRADKLLQGRIQDPDSSFGWLQSLIVGNHTRRGQSRQVGNGCGRRRVEINQPDIRVSPCLHRPSLDATLRESAISSTKQNQNYGQ